MKNLKVEDWRTTNSGFKVIRATNTVEWRMGEYIPEKDMERVLTRYGTNAVKVDIIPKS